MKFSKNADPKTSRPGKKEFIDSFWKKKLCPKKNRMATEGPWKKKKMICMAPGTREKFATLPRKKLHPRNGGRYVENWIKWFLFFLHQQRQSKELTLFQHKSWRENYKWKFQSAEGGTKKSREKRKAEWNFTTWGRQKLSPLFANCCLPTKLKQFRTLYSRFSPSLSPFSAAIFLFLTIRDAVAHKFCWFDAHFPNGLEGENSWRGGVCLSWIWMHFNIWELQRKWIGKLRKLQLLERWVWNLYCYLLGGF